MKKSFLIIAILFSAIALLAQKNEFRVVMSAEFIGPFEYDYLPDDREFSIGLEYSRAISKRLDIETGLLYSEAGFVPVLCDFCEPAFWPSYQQTSEINAKLGLKWRFMEREKIGLYTAVGSQVNRKLAAAYWDFDAPKEDHLSGALYQDLGVRFKFNKSFSIDFELKGQYNLSDKSGLYYNRDQLQIGAGMGFNYTF